MPSHSFLVMFDASPLLDPAPWMKKACETTGVFLADINAIAEEMNRDPKTRTKLLHTQKPNEDPALAADYARALEKVAAGHARVAVHSVSWIVFGQKPDVAVLDFDHLEDERAKGKKAGMTDAEYDGVTQHYRSQIEERVRPVVPKDRVLVLPAKSGESKKADDAAAFIRRFLK